MHTVSRRAYSGFTIVELLIVIVVIAILAAISVVAYVGIQNNANDAAVQSDLANLGRAVEVFHASEGGTRSLIVMQIYLSSASPLVAVHMETTFCRAVGYITY